MSYLATKIRDVSNVVSGGTPDTSNPNYWDGEINWFTPSEIGNSKYVENSKRRITSLGYKNCGAKLMSPGSILLSSRATVGDASISKTECCTNQGFQSLTDFKCCGQYLYYYLQTYRIHKSLIRRASGSTFLEISNYEVGNTDIFIPDLNIQEKIAIFLSKIDDRIETQNKIIEKYESLKIGIKESIYLLSKEKEPLEKILHEVSEKSTTQNQYPVLSSTVKGLFLQNEYFDRSIASDNNIGYKIVHKGQIIISPQNLWMGNLTFNDKYENGIVSPSYKIYDIDQKYSKKYIYWLLTSKRSFFNYGLVSEQGASIVRRNLSIDAFMGLSIPVVKDRNCESKIEKLIDLIEKKLETEKKRESLLNQQKQFLLSNLFI